MQQHGTCSIYFARRHPHPGDGVNRSKFNFFSEYGQVAHRVKEKNAGPFQK